MTLAVGMTLAVAACALDPDSASSADPSNPTRSADASAGRHSAHREAGWSPPIAAGDEFEPLVAYRARMQGDYLVIEAKHDPGWHSYAIDNEVRAAAKLAGAESLGVELPTSFVVRGATVVGAWLQTPPEDFSDQEIQWFTWGFSNTATFAAKLQGVEAAPVVIAVRGQVCDADTCRDVDLELQFDPATHQTSQALDLTTLVPVQQETKK